MWDTLDWLGSLPAHTLLDRAYLLGDQMTTGQIKDKGNMGWWVLPYHCSGRGLLEIQHQQSQSVKHVKFKAQL